MRSNKAYKEEDGGDEGAAGSPLSSFKRSYAHTLAHARGFPHKFSSDKYSVQHVIDGFHLTRNLFQHLIRAVDVRRLD